MTNIFLSIFFLNILLDMDNKKVQFFHNRVAVAPPCDILHEKIVDKLAFGYVKTSEVRWGEGRGGEGKGGEGREARWK